MSVFLLLGKENIFCYSLRFFWLVQEFNWHETDKQEKIQFKYVQKGPSKKNETQGQISNWGLYGIRKKEKGVGIWDFQDEGQTCRKTGKNKCLVNECLPYYWGTMGYKEGFDQTGFAEFPLIPHHHQSHWAHIPYNWLWWPLSSWDGPPFRQFIR